MIKEVEKRFLADRKRRKEVILANMEEYKVCETCRSISKREAALCWVCHAYRWEESFEFIRETAEIMSSTPFPFTCGTVPRFPC